MIKQVDILILGAGWTSTFLIPLCDERKLTWAATSRSGRDSTVQFEFNPESDNSEAYQILPDAKTVLITFPIDKRGASEKLVKLYSKSRSIFGGTRFVQLGTTNMWGGTRLKTSEQKPADHQWFDRNSPFTITTPRVQAEMELLALSPHYPTTVLNLSGLWGGSRSVKNWVPRVAPTKDALKAKGSLHVIHGLDVARCILAVHDNFQLAQGQRWLLTDGRVYDWWNLASAFGTPSPSSSNLNGSQYSSPQARWVQELMEEEGIYGLPRNVELLGRALDTRDFWTMFGMSPSKAYIEV